MKVYPLKVGKGNFLFKQTSIEKKLKEIFKVGNTIGSTLIFGQFGMCLLVCKPPKIFDVFITYIVTKLR